MSRFFEDVGEPKQTRKICLATTCYDKPDAGYVFSIQSSREALHKAGFQTAYYLLQGNCHVDDARNRVVQQFLASDCDYLVFLDADVSWDPEQLVRLCNHEQAIVGGVYPYRRADKAECIPARQMAGEEQGPDGLVRVEGLPTGFMKISRRVFLEMMPKTPHYNDERGIHYLFFQRTLESGTRWGGDLNFCNVWSALGGEIYADAELVLGHTGIATMRDSMASIVRRQRGETLKHVVAKIRAGIHTIRDMTEAIAYIGNPWGADESVLMLAIGYAKKADGPIIEAGSGLSTILMAAATEQPVFCLEHDEFHAMRLRALVQESGIERIGLCRVGISGDWYDVDSFRGLPKRFAFGLNDGPPRLVGNRLRFFDKLDCDVVLCDDAESYRPALSAMGAQFITDRAAVIKLKEAA